MKFSASNYFTKKKSLLYIVFFFVLSHTPVFSQIAELPFSQKVQNATDIFEGKVIRKNCFWNLKHNLIFTSNIIEVYKVFKGNITSSEVEVITEGGTVGNDMQSSGSVLQLDENSIGVFMAEPTLVVDPEKAIKIPTFRAYGSTQGFIKYDLIEKTASDPFKKYNNIETDVYQSIMDQTKKPYIVIKPFNINGEEKVKTKKESFWARHFRKKKN